MKKEHNYVECYDCNWRIAQGQDMSESPCRLCKNTRKVIDPQEILCNLCGECLCHDIVTPTGRWSCDRPHGLYNAKVLGGYESYHLFDMTRYTFSFCEKCLRQLFMQCKIKPDIADMGFDNNVMSEETWDRDQSAYEYRLWQDNGGHHQAYLDRKCNRVKDCPNVASYTVYLSDRFTEDCVCEEHKSKWSKTVNAKLVKFIPNVLKPFL